MIFFTDRDLGHLFPQILRDAGLQVERHDDYFQPDTPDDVWLPEVGRRGWIAISRNKDIYYQPNECDAIMRAGTALFIVIGPGANTLDLARNFIACRHKIERFIQANRPPFIARVYRPSTEKVRRGSRKSGEVKLWLAYTEWEQSHRR